MTEVKIKELYRELSMTAVFIRVLDKPLFAAFGEMMACEPASPEYMRAYGRFVSEIFEHGGSLPEYVASLIFEDENVYIRSRAQRVRIPDQVKDVVAHELSVFERFASLTPCDFNIAGLPYITPFGTGTPDIARRYEARIRSVRRYGYGIFSSSPMFRLSDDRVIEAISSADKTSVDKFVGYEEERGKVIANTLAFVENRPAANTLLCGDAGTGKSSTVKAVANSFFSRGVRLIELRKDQLKYLPYVMGEIRDNPLKFIIFIDDLSFNNNDDNFSMLKAALEGSASAKAENAVIYATSNRRHIVKETFGDRDGDDVHINDTMQEILSLSERFGLVVLFQKPNKNLYLEIVHELASRAGITMPAEELDIKAEAFALRKGNRSARCAEQFIESLLA